MTLDTDTGHFHPSPPRKSYNPFDSDDDTLDSPGLKSECVYTQKDHAGNDPKPFEKGPDAGAFHVDDVDLSWEEDIFGQPEVNASANGHSSLFVQDGQLYTDKNVTDCELPELEVCYKENQYQSVKDIGIDEGVPIHDKLWVQTSEDESKDSSSLLALSGKGHDVKNAGMDFGPVDVLEIKDAALHPGQDPSTDILKEDVLNEDSLKITELKLDSEKQTSYPADWIPMEVEAAAVGLVYDVADSHPATETDPNTDASKCELDLIGEDGSDHDDTEEKKGDDVSPDKADDGRVQEPSTGEGPSKVIIECEEVKVESDESPNEDKTLLNSSEDPNETASNGKLESGSVTFDSNSSTTSSPGSQEDEPQNAEPEKPPTTQSMTRHEEAISTHSTLTGLEPRAYGETSFSSSASVPLPSSITFMGPVAYSGNISLRSESSAGSTRSFAFPVLQNEWNSSPVRMAKADPRHFKKQRGWMEALICCRF